MRVARLAFVSLVVGSVFIAAACSGKKSTGSGTPTATPTGTPVTGSITALTGAGAFLVDNSTDTSSSTFSISVTANGQPYTDTGVWNCFGPIAASGPGDSYDFFFSSGTTITNFDINIPAALWTSAGPITLSVGTGATGAIGINGVTSFANMTGGSITVTNAPTAENSSSSICNFHLTTPITFSDAPLP
jgi:hypothetical protein